MRWLRQLLLVLAFHPHSSRAPSLVTRPKLRVYQTGKASWYGRKFHGRRTASGERFNMFALTAASRTLPLGSYAQVTNPRNHKSVWLRINDRGPWNRRIMDLSYGSARALGISGVGNVIVEVPDVDRGSHRPASAGYLQAPGV